MFDRPIEMYNEAMAGDIFMLLITVIWGILMAAASYKIAGWVGFNEKWRKISAVAGFVTMGLFLFGVLPGRALYKFITKKEDQKDESTS